MLTFIMVTLISQLIHLLLCTGMIYCNRVVSGGDSSLSSSMNSQLNKETRSMKKSCVLIKTSPIKLDWVGPHSPPAETTYFNS